MVLRTPDRRWKLWVLGNICVLGQLPAAVLYYTRQLNAGAYSPEADSIGIPIMGTAVSILVVLVPLNLIWWALLHRYPGAISIGFVSKNLSMGLRVIASLCVLVAAMCIAAAISEVRVGAFESSVLFLLSCYVAFAVRAAFVAAQSRS